MKARMLVEGASFNPEQLKIVGKAFDRAWDEIKPSVSTRAEAMQAARMKLANAVLAIARTADPFTIERIKEHALGAMRADPIEPGSKR